MAHSEADADDVRAIFHHMIEEGWRMLAMYDESKRKCTLIPALEQAREQLHLSDEDLAAELDQAESNLVRFPVPHGRQLGRNSTS